MVESAEVGGAVLAGGVVGLGLEGLVGVAVEGGRVAVGEARVRVLVHPLEARDSVGGRV